MSLIASICSFCSTVLHRASLLWIALCLSACQISLQNRVDILPTPSPTFFDTPALPTGQFEIQKIEDELQHLIYKSPIQGYVTAYMIEPTAQKPLPAAIYLHPAESGIKSQLQEARQLAAEGFVVLLIDSPRERPKPWNIAGDKALPNHDRDTYRQHVIDTRRAVDILSRQKSVDASRISIIGKNLGGGITGILSGVEDRVDRFVIQAAIPELGKFWPNFDHPVANKARAEVGQERLQRYAQETAVTDAIHYVDIRDDKRVLYQWGLEDNWLTHEQAKTMVRRTTGEVSSLWYEEGHGMTSDKVVNDYIEWLKRP